MSLDAKLLIRVFSPATVGRALNSLDKSTGVIVTACWLAALVTLILALFAVRSAVSSQKEAIAATVAEPVLPTIASASITPREIQQIVDRLQRQFPDIKIDSKQGTALEIRSDDGTKFHQWITALSYVDTMAPQFRWTLREFCAGACANGQLMGAVLSGQKTVLSAPTRKD